MKFIATVLILGSFIMGGSQVFAQEIQERPLEVIQVSDQDLLTELAELKDKEGTATGVFARFILKLRIKQLENQLNIEKALE